MSKNNFDPKTYYAMALDPIHVGTGGYRLGRVDNTIVREPGTNLPKIPGTSLSGVTRTYLAMQVEGKYPRCAGQGQEKKDEPTSGHCGKEDCLVCTTFGFSKKQNSFSGLANFSDMHVMLFPVGSMQGPVWITSPGQLSIIGDGQKMPSVSENKVKLSKGLNSPINLGWLLLESEGAIDEIETDESIPNDIKARIVLVSNKLFGQIVKTNLEVRTSVAIDPATGAADDGALFTYEAIPRSTIFCFDVVCQSPAYYRIGGKEITAFQSNNSNSISSVRDAVEKGFCHLEYLGIGGMNSRGMGRMKVLNIGGNKNGA
ncbi:MAG: type III-B CRISPR module RAMP protein Cmr4 [Deltaproteobacteria bacterium]|nr:MAG: type III-B CRISPR module RAMP protein Cmr4 [Deltaproteobacteria bacterium]